MTVASDFVRRVISSVGLFALVLLLAVVLASVALSPASNWTVRTALVGFVVLAVARPDAALLVTMAFAGFSIVLSHLAGVPALRATEVLVVASLAGFGVRALWSAPYRRALAASVSLPAVILALAAVSSAVVWQRVFQADPGNAAMYFPGLWRFATRTYFIEPGDFTVLVSTAVLLEGLALYVVATALCRLDPTFFDRALRMLTFGGAGLAVFSLVRLTEILLRNPAAIDALRATSVGLRISPQIPDYIAAGSYFALCWLAALGLALGSPRQRLVWLSASVLLVAGLYLTGSRSVIGAAMVGVVVPVLIVIRQRGAARRGLVAFAALSVVVMIVSYSWMSGRDVAGEMARQSLVVRAELLRAGGRVIATRPVFGIGMDRFYLLAGTYASPELQALWPGRMNPHNDFLRFTAELGIVGGAAFLFILVAAVIPIGRALFETRDARLAGLAGGLVAFLVTCLFSNPLMVRDVSFVFWTALGLAAGHSRTLMARARVGMETTASAADGSSAGARLRWGTVFVAGVVLFASIPSRARQELTAINPTGGSSGFFEWNADTDGTRWRWSAPRATVFVDTRARVIEIPLSGGPAPDGPQEVEIQIDGRLANRITVGPDWQRLRTLLPSQASTEPHRIDLVVSPAWIPAEVLPGSQDRRPHGVRVGEIAIIKEPSR